MTEVTALKRHWTPILFILILAATAAGLGYVALFRDDGPPEGIAVGNGRIEATRVDVATKIAGRIAEVVVEEGDFVAVGDVLARLDTSSIRADLAVAEANVQRFVEAEREAEAAIALRESDQHLAQTEYERAAELFDKGHTTQQTVDQRQAALNATRAAIAAAEAALGQARAATLSARATVDRIKVDLNDAELKAPVTGRVEYRVAEPGEVLGVSGVVVTLLDYTDVTMSIFLPTATVGLIDIGADARIVLDGLPGIAIPAHVSFVSADAQFTPREVETKSERDKLVFRVKVRIPPELLERYREKVRAGLPGVAYVKLDPAVPWPDWLAQPLPEPEGAQPAAGGSDG